MYNLRRSQVIPSLLYLQRRRARVGISDSRSSFILIKPIDYRLRAVLGLNLMLLLAGI